MCWSRLTAISLWCNVTLRASLGLRRPCLTDLLMMKSAAKSSAFLCAMGYRLTAFFGAIIFSTYVTETFSAGSTRRLRTTGSRSIRTSDTSINSRLWVMLQGRSTCPFRKFHPVRDWPAEIESSHHNQRCFLSFGVVSENSIRRRFRVVRQNHYIIRIDVCDPAWARNVRRRPVCTENLIRVDEVRESLRLTR